MKVSDIFEEILREQRELKELYGVSFDARAWTPIIKGNLNIGKKYYDNRKPIPDLTIIGKDYPEQYRKFPVDVIHIVLNGNYRRGAVYDEKKSGYDENKQYHVYLDFGTEANESAINHELRHAYEDYMRLSRGAVGSKDTYEGRVLFGGDFEKFMKEGRDLKLEPFISLMIGLYYTSKLERSGYSETVYDNDENFLIIKKINQSLKIANMAPFYDVIPDFAMESNWNRIKREYNLPIFNKFNDYDSFIEWAANEIKYKGQKTLKKLLKTQYHSQQNKQKGTV